MQTETTIANSVVPSLKMESTFIPYQEIPESVKDWQVNWKVRLILDERTIIETDYHQGIGHLRGYNLSFYSKMSIRDHKQISTVLEGGRSTEFGIVEPNIDDVLSCLIMDADVLTYDSFDDWAECMGYDTDSRKAEETYRACIEIGLKLRNRLGEETLPQLQEAYSDY